MGEMINDKGKQRELVRIVSAHSTCGYVTTYRDAMKEGDMEFGVAPAEVDQAPPLEPKTAIKRLKK